MLRPTQPHRERTLIYLPNSGLELCVLFDAEWCFPAPGIVVPTVGKGFGNHHSPLDTEFQDPDLGGDVGKLICGGVGGAPWLGVRALMMAFEMVMRSL